MLITSFGIRFKPGSRKKKKEVIDFPQPAKNLVPKEGKPQAYSTSLIEA